MATFAAVLTTVGGNATSGMALPMPAVGARPGAGGSVVTSATSQVVESGGSAVVVPAEPGNLVWRLQVDAGPVWVAFGEAPVAAAGVGYYMSAGESLLVQAKPGDSCAVING